MPYVFVCSCTSNNSSDGWSSHWVISVPVFVYTLTSDTATEESKKEEHSRAKVNILSKKLKQPISQYRPLLMVLEISPPLFFRIAFRKELKNNLLHFPPFKLTHGFLKSEDDHWVCFFTILSGTHDIQFQFMSCNKLIKSHDILTWNSHSN